MRTFLFVFLLPLPASAGNPCTVQSTGLCTPDEKQKLEILQKLEDAQKADRESSKAFKEWQDARTKTDQVAAIEKLKRFDKEMRGKYNDAIRMTQEAYHITLPQTEGNIAKPRDPNGLGDWSMGLPAAWNPQFYSRDKQYLQAKGMDNQLHNLGGEIAKEVSGRTYADGRVIITPKILDDALAFHNPGMLAYVIHHEANHFTELITRGWDNAEEGEVRSYKKSLEAADIFELDKTVTGPNGETFKDEIRGHLKEFSKALISGLRTSPYPDAKEEKDNEKGFIEEKKRDDEFEKMLSQLKDGARKEKKEADWNASKALEPRFTAELRSIVRRLCKEPGSVSQEEFDALPFLPDPGYYTAMPRSFSGNNACENYLYDDVITQSILGGHDISRFKELVRKYRDLAVKEQRAWRQEMRWRIEADANSCDLRARFNEDEYLTTFRIPEGSAAAEYFFDTGVDRDAVMVNFLFVSVCADLYDHVDNEPCNHSLENIVKRRWDEPGFKAMIGVSPYAPIATCVDYIRDNLKLPATISSLKRTAKVPISEWERKIKAAQKERRGSDNAPVIEQRPPKEKRDEPGNGCSSPNSRTGIIGCPAPAPQR